MLSRRAQQLLVRVKRGEWYSAYGAEAPPRAMQELIDAGLVTTAGRVATVKTCYVPVGFKPHVPEAYPESE